MCASLALIGCLLVGQVESPAADELSLKVERLVRSLNAPELVRREAAEADLVRLGPAALELLPDVTERTPAEIKLRLGRIRQRLQQIAAESAAQPARVTLRGDALQLAKVLEAIQSQTGNRIVYDRERLGDEAGGLQLKLRFDKVPFWKALDDVLDQARLDAYPYGGERAVHIVPRGGARRPRTASASYAGPFRFEVVRVVAERELRQPEDASLRVVLEVAWEPRLQPISLKQRARDTEAFDENGNRLSPLNEQAVMEVPGLPDASAEEITLPFELPPRSVRAIARLKGRLMVLLPGKTKAFRFGKLLTAKNVEQRAAGAVVKLEQVRKNNEIWEVRIRVRFDEVSGALQSHLGWIYQNEAYLETPDGQAVAYDALETTMQTENEVGFAYLFALEKPPEALTFVYKTPVAILPAEFDFELTDIQLP